jgi:uncharacterized protein YbjQ (UPF0145 family)
MANWTPPTYIPHSPNDAESVKYHIERAKLGYLAEAGAMDTNYDTELQIIRNHIKNKSRYGEHLKNLSEADLQDLAQKVTINKTNNAKILAQSQKTLAEKFPMSKIEEITAKWAGKARGLVITNLSKKDQAKYHEEVAAFKKKRAEATWNTDSYKAEIEGKIYDLDFELEMLRTPPEKREALIKEKIAEIKGNKYDIGLTDPEEKAAAEAKLIAKDKQTLKRLEGLSKKYRSPAGSYTGESAVEVAVRKAKEGLSTATDKTKKAGNAVVGALDTAGEKVQKGVKAVVPGTGPAVSTPSPVVRPTAPAANTPPPAAPAASAASTPPPAGLPPPPSAAPAPAAGTPPPANLPPPPSASGSRPPDTQNPKYLPSQPSAPTANTPTAPSGQNYPAAGREGVVGVTDEGVRVALEGDDVKGRKWEPKVGKTIPAVTPSESRPSGPVNTVPYGTTTPLKPDSAKGRSGVVVTDASGNKKVGFVSTQVPVRPTVSTPIENPSILSDLVGPIVESAKMIGGVAGKGTMDVVSGAANLIKKAVVPTNPRDILRGNTEAAKAKAPTTEAKPAPDNLPKYAYGYDPLTGKQTAGPAKSTSYGHLSSRVSILRDRNLVPFLSGRNAADLKNELAARHGASDLETFIQKAVNRSGLFTATEAGQVVQQLKSDPIFKGLIDAGMPVDRQKGPFKAGGAPKVEVKDAQGNVLPKGNAVPKATPPVETARDRLDAIRKAEAQRIAAEQARVAAEQAAETQRVATATAAFTEEQRLAAQAEAERKAIIEAFQNRSPAGNEPSFPAGTRFGEALPFVGNSGVTRQDRLRQISAENKKGVTVDEVLLQRWLKNRTATSTPESQAATGRPAPYIRGMERGVKPPSAGAQALRTVGGTALQGVGFAPDVFNAARLLKGGAITPDGQILSQTEQMTAAIERMKNLGKPVQPVEDTPWYVNLANLPVEMAKQSWDDIQAIGKFGKYEKTKAQETEEALQRFVDEANARRLYGIPRDGETF